MKTAVPDLPVPGRAYVVGRAASIQFAEPIAVRVIDVTPPAPYDLFCWLDVYEINRCGDAIRRRSIYVKPAGLVAVNAYRAPRARRLRPALVNA